MSGFLDAMALSSTQRVQVARRRESLGELENRARRTPRAAPLRLSAEGFDVIAEMKLRSPAAGALGAPTDDWLGRITAYARGGAAAVSVLTEPSRFDGSLEHLRQAAAALAPLDVPTMRKDFLVDPYQVTEARAAGAGGVLVIVRMLSRARIIELLDAAAHHEMFVLLEAFDAADLSLARDILAPRRRDPIVLVGVNSRDLQSLQVVPQSFSDLAPNLPAEWHCVAESGVATARDAQAMRRLGYGLALIGTALMAADDPAVLLGSILRSARAVQD